MRRQADQRLEGRQCVYGLERSEGPLRGSDTAEQHSS